MSYPVLCLLHSIALELSAVQSADVSAPFFFNDTATTEIYTLSLHDALPILTATTTPAPRVVVNVQNVSVAQNATIAGSSLIASISNPNGDSITEYVFEDRESAHRHFRPT